MENIRKWLMKNKFILFGGIICIQFFIIISFMLKNNEKRSTEPVPFDSWIESAALVESSVESIVTESEVAFFIVDVKGEIMRPGVYQVEQGMRIDDVIQMAGGVNENAETREINFSRLLEDQMMIYIPHKDDEAIIQSPAESQSSHERRININIANETELQVLTGIGQKKAQQIIQHRTENGLFRTIEELTDVSGIGQKTFEAIREQITVSD